MHPNPFAFSHRVGARPQIHDENGNPDRGFSSPEIPGPDPFGNRRWFAQERPHETVKAVIDLAVREPCALLEFVLRFRELVSLDESFAAKLAAKSSHARKLVPRPDV